MISWILLSTIVQSLSIPASDIVHQKRALDVNDPNNSCLPLTSQSPEGNPYHSDLLGVDPNTVVTRTGYGRATQLDGPINTSNTGGVEWSFNSKNGNGTFHIEANRCVIPLSFPQVKSTTVPFLCKTSGSIDKDGYPAFESVVTEHQQKDQDEYHLIRFIDCGKVPEDEFTPGPWYDYIEEEGIHSDAVFTSSMMTVPTAGGYYFGWSAENEFQVRRVGPNGVPSNDDPAVWSNKVKLLSAGKVSLKITEQGHLNVYAEINGKQQLGWSSLPANLNYQVGVYGDRFANKNFGYRLKISNKGIPELFDSSYVKVWSGDNNRFSGNKHGYGYSFPINETDSA